MKNKFVSAGLVAIGAAGLQSAFADGLDIVTPKAWNVSATLRGFYDDNYTATGAGKGSPGIEFSPTISYHFPLQQTEIGMRYIYGLYYYQQRQEANIDPIDQTHQFDFWLDHAINERWKANVTDTFVIGQEPALLSPNNLTVYRANGNNIANRGSVGLETEWTRKFSTALSYGNNIYDYENSGSKVANAPTVNLATIVAPVLTRNGITGWQTVSPSLAGSLNRVEQNFALDLQWHFQPETMGFVGYNLGLVNYTQGEEIGAFNFASGYSGPILGPYAANSPKHVVYYSDSRDSLTHYGYVGVQHSFTANLSASARGGVSYTDSYNDPLQETTSLSPYADISASYTYLPGSYMQIGFTHDINTTDIAAVDTKSGSLTQYQESSSFYADINHKLNPKTLATLIARYQYSTYNGGPYNNGSDAVFSFGANLHYQINRYFAADAGYNFDDLTTGVNDGHAYVRNRVYIGLSAGY